MPASAPDAGADESSPAAVLALALRIPGAHSVALISVGARTPIWWAGADDPRASAPEVAALAEAASDLLRTTSGSAVDDLLLTSADHFHVLRLIAGPGHDSEVAHLTLRRTAANLGLARREFGALVSSYRSGGQPPVPDPAPARDPRPTAAPPPLPRRQAAWVPPAAPPSWFGPLGPGGAPGPLGHPYTDDTPTLDRIIDALNQI